ncbi:hypothetical protein DH2020_009543 [Rehmannia glutinosa]|uniref:RanBP2-type domain-containing protein n=1 Tax=Rehmannia glutinosa TaxID=99300 RepID=A0ABR0X9M9_REHGL
MERGRGGMLGLLLVQAVTEYYRLDRKPPVTAGLIAANTLIYFRPSFLDPILPPSIKFGSIPTSFSSCSSNGGSKCVSTDDCSWAFLLSHKDLKRFLLSAFYHIGESHLVYNMLSLLWKGIQLESAMGSVEFASMVAALVGMSQGITLLLAKSLLLFDYERAYYNEYSVGFSGVLFAMKVVLYSQSDNYTYVHGLIVPARFAAWAELILVQMFVPGVSFLGHLGGVLAGLLYVYLKASHPGANPFMKIIRGFTNLLGWPFRFAQGMFRPSRSRVFGRGTLGRSEAGNISGVWRCRACTYDNTGLLSVCEVCGTGRNDNGWYPSSSDTETISLKKYDSGGFEIWSMMWNDRLKK